MKKIPKSNSAWLRQKTEELLKKKPSKTGLPISEDETLKLIHEMDVHQIELEIQNEELIRTKEQAEVVTEKYIELYDFAPLGYFTLSSKGKIIELNLSGANMLGIERSRLKNKLLSFFVSDDTKPVFNLFLGKVLHSKAKETCELSLNTNGNLPIYVYLTGIAAENGEQCLITVFDFTERKRAEEIIQQEKDFSKAALDSLPGLFYLFDDQGKFLRWNKNFEYLSGYTTEEITHHSPLDFFDEADKIKIAEVIQKVFQYGQSSIEADFQSKDKTKTPTFFSGKRFQFESKQCLIGMGIDITQLKQAEEQIAKLSNAVDQAADIVFITTREGIIEYLNPAFETITGYNKAEALGNTPRILKSGLMDLQYYQRVWTTILSGKVLRGEVINRTKNGDIFFYDQTITPLIGVDGKVTHFISTGKDITERKRTEILLQKKNEELTKTNEELIKAKERAEESDKLKTAFLNNISHEIRTPFNGILGFLSMLQDDDVSVSDRDEYISIINKSANRLMNTINDIVEISKIQTGQIKLTVTDTNISRLTRELFDKFKADAESKRLKFNVNNNLPKNIESINTDIIKLNVVLSNLIGNAIKFTKSGSIEFGISKNDDCLLFSVKDTGIGIPENKQQAIFDRFIQADVSTTRKFEGAGLGLAISKAYVEMLGGKIWVESDPDSDREGKGSVFYFTIPYNAEPEEENVIKNVASTDKAENQINPEVSGLKILIAEDDQNSEKLLSTIVRKLSKEVLKARTGVEAVEACRNNPDIDLILMDIEMPEMNGYEATQQIRQFNTTVVIIAQTAFAQTSDKEKSIESGCNDYISKPIKRIELMELIEKHFKKKQ